MSGTSSNDDFDDDTPLFDEEWVRSAEHTESSADERADRYARINAGHQRVQEGEQSWRGNAEPQRRGGLSLTRWVLAIAGMPQKFVFQGVHMVFDGKPLDDQEWKADEVKENRMIFIGKKLDKDELLASFKECMVE